MADNSIRQNFFLPKFLPLIRYFGKIRNILYSIGKLNESSGVCKKKRHSIHPNRLDFDKTGMLNEVQNLPRGSKVSILSILDNTFFALKLFYWTEMNEL